MVSGEPSLTTDDVGNKIPAIENLAVTRDQFDTIDLTDNELRRLENFPILRRLRTLLLSNNSISRFDPELASRLPKLEMLVLNGNSVESVESLAPLGGLKLLRYLSLIDCPVSRTPHYRLRVIRLLPQLRALDFRRVTAGERKAARELSEEALQSEEIAAEEPPRKLAKIDRERIAEALQNAKSLEEIKQLERILATGHVPDL